MSLSAWDGLAFDQDGNAVRTGMALGEHASIQARKNWLYIYDEKAWEAEPVAFSEPIVASVWEGRMRYKHLRVVAWRGPQEGIFFAAWYWHERKHLRGIIGCGVRSESHEPPYRQEGVKPETLQWFREKIAGLTPEDDDWSDDYIIPTALRWVLVFADPLRFNQGDAYFADHFGVATPATPPGEAAPSVLSQTIKGEG